MATGFGIPNDDKGNGTTPDDIQAITAAEYPEAGIISGCEVTGTSTMAWKVSAGAAVVHLAAGRAVRVPVPAQTITTAPAPPTGTRSEYIYVKQNTVATDGNINATVGVGASVPANAVMLSQRNITECAPQPPLQRQETPSIPVPWAAPSASYTATTTKTTRCAIEGRSSAAREPSTFPQIATLTSAFPQLLLTAAPVNGNPQPQQTKASCVTTSTWTTN